MTMNVNNHVHQINNIQELYHKAKLTNVLKIVVQELCMLINNSTIV